MENLNEYLHGADEDGGESLDPLQAAHQDLSVHLVGQLLLAGVHVPGHLRRMGSEVSVDLLTGKH